MQHFDAMADPASRLEAGEGRLGMVFKKSQGEYAVESNGERIPCDISNALRKQLLYHMSAGCTHPPTDPKGCPRCRPGGSHRSVVAVHDIREQDPVAVGDWVRFVVAGAGQPPASHGPAAGQPVPSPSQPFQAVSSYRGLITEVLPRKNTLERRAAGKQRLKQIIAANVDQVLAVVAAAQPHPAWDLLDRYLVSAEEADIPACILITKCDLIAPDAFGDILDAYRRIGYPVVLTSTVTRAGIADVREALGGKISVLAGKSGVGKTTLLNTIQPGLGLRVGEVSRTGPQAGKGKHTTSHVEMVSLKFGGAIVDTPGMREFGFWDATTARQRREKEVVDLAEYFREMRPYLGLCRFGLDCSHTHEPRCAIKDAVEAGEISSRRYHNYLLLSGRA